MFPSRFFVTQGANMLEVYKTGDIVVLGGAISAKVICTIIEGDRVTYEVGYWEGNNYVKNTLPSWEVSPWSKTEKTPIGFKK